MQIRCCFECKKRKLGCHGECEKYKAEKEALKKAKEKAQKAKMESDYIQRTDGIYKRARRG